MTLQRRSSAASRIGSRPASKERLRLWLRLLRTSRAIEVELRERLRVTFGVTLAKFDVLAALERRPMGMTMTELSRFLMVSNGNVTGLVDRLVADQLVERRANEEDRRATIVRLTPKGARQFAAMARAHEAWVNEILGAFSSAQTETMIALLDAALKHRRSTATEHQESPNVRQIVRT